MKFLKFLLGVGVIGAAGAAIATKKSRDKKRQAELDEFLMPEDDTVIIDVPKKEPESLTKLEADLYALENEKENILPLTFIFSFENFEEANKFKNELTLRTITSTINDQDCFVEVIYNDSITHDAFTVLLNDFKEAMEKSQVTYQGYRYFAK